MENLILHFLAGAVMFSTGIFCLNLVIWSYYKIHEWIMKIIWNCRTTEYKKMKLYIARGLFFEEYEMCLLSAIENIPDKTTRHHFMDRRRGIIAEIEKKAGVK